ncbi:MAG: 6-bladed beta-propeller [Firmicutes bacterium]|nr:6-bladed beta-propeller [Bacillota bacterium]
MKKLILILFIAITACQNSHNSQSKDLRVIDVEGGVGKGRLVKLSEVAESIEYIPLETNSELMLGKIFYDRVFYEKGIFYLMERNQSTILFDKLGKYVNKISKPGGGPRDVSMSLDMDVDHNSGNILFMEKQRIIEYSPNGELINTINFRNNPLLAELRLNRFKKIGNNYLLQLHVNQKTKYSLMGLDTATEVVSKILYPEQDYEIFSGEPLQVTQPNSFKYRESVRLINGYSNCILSIDKDHNIDTAYFLNFGKYRADINNPDQFSFKAPWLWSRFEIYESDTYLFMTYHLGSLSENPAKVIGRRGPYDYQHECSVFNKKTGEFQFIHQPEINQLGFVEDFEGGPAIWPKYVSSDGYLITYMYARDFKSYALTHKVSDKYKQMADSLNDNDNPVIVRVKLK